MFFRTVNILLPILFLSGAVCAQGDSLRTSIPLTACIMPLVFISAGSAVSGSVFEKNIQQDVRNSIGENFGFNIDDYTALAPAAGVYIFDWCGIKAENSFFDRVKYMAVANLASQTVVQGLKYTTDKLRPDREDRLSFPSNHTNIAFTNAMIIWHEYRRTNALAAYSGFVVATGTGALRMVHDKHWTGDVLAGAGIGMLCANLVYRFRPLENWRPFGTGERKLTLLPDVSDDEFGLTLICNF